jgi:bacterioferritin
MAKASGKADNTKKVIDLLNDGRARELGAILQYMAHHYELEDADFGKLAKTMKEIAIQEMKHAEKLAERILFLGGTPTSQLQPQPKKGQTIPEMLATDESLETGAVQLYNASAVRCSELGDQISKELFEKLLADEEGHLDTFQNVAAHLKQMGESYLATLAGGAAE